MQLDMHGWPCSLLLINKSAASGQQGTSPALSAMKGMGSRGEELTEGKDENTDGVGACGNYSPAKITF